MVESQTNSLKVFKMCTKLKELNGLTPELILNEYWNSERNVYPIDIAQILYNLKIRVLPYDFSKFDGHNLENRILGAAIADENNLALLYRKGETKNRNRFTLAHELAHCCLAHLDEETMPYIEWRHDGVVTDKCEIAANIFAGELLVPTKELRKVLSNEYPTTLPHITKLASMFAVSINVMKERLKQLEIPYIDEYERKSFCLE